ncbi:MAG: MCP four helix bundle domain-containing protein, partial [Macromonas sp.]
MTIIKRLMLIIGILAAVMAGMAVWNYVQLNQVVVLADKAESVRVPQLHDIAEVELNVTRVSLQLRHAMLARTPQERQAAFDDIAQKRQYIERALQNYEQKLYTERGRALFAPVPGLVRAFWERGEANLRLIQDGRKEEAFAYLVDHTIPARNALLQVLAGTVHYQTQTLSSDIVAITSLIHTTQVLSSVALLGMVAALVLFAVWMRRTLHQRIGVCQTVVEQVRDGNLTGIALDGQSDEFAPLMTALAEMEQSLTRVVVGVRRSA